MRRLSPFCLITVVLLGASPQAFAQRAPAIPGVTGTIVTPETAKQEKKLEDKTAVAVKEAVARPATGPLADLKPGMTVVVRFGNDANEGKLSKIDRKANEITVRYESKREETLVLTDRQDRGTAIVEYSDEAKQKVTRYFKSKS